MNQKEINGEQRDIIQEFGRIDQLTGHLGSKHKLEAATLDACIKKQDDSKVRASMAEGEKLGVDSTPTMFVNASASSVPRRNKPPSAVGDARNTQIACSIKLQL